MVKRNCNFINLKPNYLFQEIGKRAQAFKLQNPNAKVISLSIGDTSEPIPKIITNAMEKTAMELSTREGYRGYGPEQGDPALRHAIAHHFYKGMVEADEIFISDGAKCDIGRIQVLFGSEKTIAVQDPAYPVYVDTSLILGQKKIIFLLCHQENNFLFNIDSLPKVDLIYFCSPNNPTGTVASKDYLTKLIAKAGENKSIIIFDSAYAGYIQDPLLPRSIFEIPYAKKRAIEVSSFSKFIGFTGVRLGWTVIPKELTYEDGTSIHADFSRLYATFFNGASHIAQKGGLATITVALEEMKMMAKYYMENARLIRNCLLSKGLTVYGGENAPYLWTYFKNMKSWEAFRFFLEKLHIVTTPGVGFGSSGEGFIRFSAFGERNQILHAIERVNTSLDFDF